VHRRLVSVVVPIVACLALSPGAWALIRYVERTDGSGITLRTTNGDPKSPYIIDTLGSGAALFDYDADGDMDLYFVNGSSLEIPAGQEPPGALYRNEGGGRFTDVTRQALLEDHFWGFGVASGDYDNDGDPDLYVTAWGPNRLYRNEGDGTFRNVAPEAGVDDPRWGTSAAFLDYDGDGLLDLFAANYVTFDPAKIPRAGDPNSPCAFRGLMVMCGPHGLPGAVNILYHNNGDGTFTDVHEQAGLFMGGTYYGLGVATVDIDGDRRQEILVANDSTANHLYRNLGDGRFVDEGVMAGFSYSNDGREQAGMGIYPADIDNDLDMDVLITNFSHDYTTLRINDGGGMLEDVSVRIGLAEHTLRTLGWGTIIFDPDNDGDRDIFIANGHVYPEVEQADIGTKFLQPCQIFENLGEMKLREVLPAPEDRENALHHAATHRALAAGDIDDDGDVDLVVTANNGRPRLLVNESALEGGARGNWLHLRLVGRASNRDGVGVRVIARAGGKSWLAERIGGGSFLSACDPRLHLGLGPNRQVDSMEVTWPSGARQTLGPVQAGRTLILEEPPLPSPGPAARPAEKH
jgi:hypothetical protein